MIGKSGLLRAHHGVAAAATDPVGRTCHASHVTISVAWTGSHVIGGAVGAEAAAVGVFDSVR